MWSRWSRIAFALGALGAVVFLGLVVNQTAQPVSLAAAVHPTLGTAVLGTLLAVYAVCFLAPVVLFFRLPKPLDPPAADEGQAFERHLRALGDRLAHNRRAGRGPFRTREQIEAGLDRLGARADDIARRSAAEVFVATAVSQHGSLDAIVMLGAQARMVWRIAHVYHQRPGARELAHLYARARVAFVGGRLDRTGGHNPIDAAMQGVPVAMGPARFKIEEISARLEAAGRLHSVTGAADLAARMGFGVAHADLTLICERPRIGPHSDAMRDRLAALLRIDRTRVSVKATTTERLGFAGRGEGIAALATVTLVAG